MSLLEVLAHSFFPARWGRSGWRVMMLVGFLVLTAHPARAEISRGNMDLGSILFLGDSITQGGNDQDGSRTVRSCLYELLTRRGYTFNFTGHTITNGEGLPVTGNSASNNLYRFHSGVAGAVIGDDFMDSTGRVRTGLTQNFPDWWQRERLDLVKPNLILIMIGTNDVDLDIDLDRAYTRLIDLLYTIYTQPDAGEPTILLASIPPNRTDPVKEANVRKFNARIPYVVRWFQRRRKDVHFVFQFLDLDRTYDESMLPPPELHPNGTGDMVIAQRWYAAIEKIVQPQRHPFKPQ